MRVSSLDGRRAIGVSAGGRRSVVVLEDGTVLSWGVGLLGELGLGAAGICSFPRPVPELTSIRSVACGDEHTLCVTEQGGVFAFGANTHGMCARGRRARAGRSWWLTSSVVPGQLGLGFASKSVPTPAVVTLLEGITVVKACAGSRFSVFLTGARALRAARSGLTRGAAEGGAVMTCGQPRFGQLGRPLGRDVSRADAEPVPAIVPYFQTKKVPITDIAVGDHHVLALTRTWRARKPRASAH